MEAVAKFEKISFEQWCKDFRDIIFRVENTKEDYDALSCPVRKTKGSAGYDFECPINTAILPHKTETIPTGIKCQIDEGYVLEMYPRSSLGFSYKMTLDNTVGIIDSDYYNNCSNEGHIMCRITNHSDKVLFLQKGQSFVQGIFKKFYITKDDEVTSQRVGGIGSTDT